jgi:hypothetical protein
VRPQFRKGTLECVWQNACFTDDRHEVCIANPSGNNVQVQVMFDSSPSTSPQIHADVKTVRLIDLLNGLFARLRQVHHFRANLGRTERKIGDMFIGSYQEMSARVRINIQNDKIEFSPMENEISFVIFSSVTETEDTAI